MDLDHFRQLPILGIVRGIEADAIEPLTEVVISSGLRTIEITMNTPGAPSLIRQMIDAAHGRLTLGAGTVLSMSDLHQALEAGASFIVMPTLVTDVMEYCVSRGIPTFPGALTPQEIHNAWKAGATMVKVFPSQFFGPRYFREIKGPFRNTELLACGGVTPDTIKDYFECGASAVAIGDSVFNRESMQTGGYSQLEAGIRALIHAWQETRHVAATSS